VPSILFRQRPRQELVETASQGLGRSQVSNWNGERATDRQAATFTANLEADPREQGQCSSG
jgi:hypothetical protein